MPLVDQSYREAILEMFGLNEDFFRSFHREPILDDWFSRDVSFSEIIPLSEFSRKYWGKEIDNFVYYRPKGMVFTSLSTAYHCNFMSGLYNLHQLAQGKRETSPAFSQSPRLTNMFCQKYDGQDLYLSSALGVYQSSCGIEIYYHKNLKLNPQEQEAFKDLKHDIGDWK